MKGSRSIPGLGVTPLWLMEKAKNHTGYGFDGRVNPGEVQSTAVSGDTPASRRSFLMVLKKSRGLVRWRQDRAKGSQRVERVERVERSKSRKQIELIDVNWAMASHQDHGRAVPLRVSACTALSRRELLERWTADLDQEDVPPGCAASLGSL